MQQKCKPRHKSVRYQLFCFECSLAADIVVGRLESAKAVGADVVINCKEENLKDRGIYQYDAPSK